MLAKKRNKLLNFEEKKLQRAGSNEMVYIVETAVGISKLVEKILEVIIKLVQVIMQRGDPS